MAVQKTHAFKILAFLLPVVLFFASGSTSYAYSQHYGPFSLDSGNIYLVSGQSGSYEFTPVTGIIQLNKWMLIDHSYMFKLSFDAKHILDRQTADLRGSINSCRYFVNINGVRYYLDQANSCYFTLSGNNTNYFSFGAEITLSTAAPPGLNPGGVYWMRYYIDISNFSFDVDDLGVSSSTITGAINNQTNVIKEQTDAIEEGNKLQEEANETSKGILGKITEFFNGFFDNLGKFFLGLIVPSAEELNEFLLEVNDWFSERLGFIWYPFDLAIDLVSSFALGDPDQNFKVPAFTLSLMGHDYVIWNEFSFDIDAFDIFKYVRYFTSTLLVCGVVRMAINKWDEWIGGHASG